MAGTKNRTDAQKEEDYLFISKQLVKNVPYREIAELLNEENKHKGYTLSKSQIGNDVKVILDEWREERTETVDKLVDKELLKIAHLERECWDGWEKSKGGKRTTKISGGSIVEGQVGAGKIKERTIEDTFGDTRFIDKILTCIDKRRDIVGYGAAKKIEHSGKIDSHVTGTTAVGFVQMSDEEMEKEAKRILTSMIKSNKPENETNAGGDTTTGDKE